MAGNWSASVTMVWPRASGRFAAAVAMLVVPTLLAPADGDLDVGDEEASEPLAGD